MEYTDKLIDSGMGKKEFEYYLENFPEEYQKDEKLPLKIGGFMAENGMLSSRFTMLPSIGILEGFRELEPSRKIISKIILWFSLWYMKRSCNPDRPGWNDFYMAKWFITRKQKYLNELISRTNHVNEQVRESCKWMLMSVASRHEDLNNALQELGYKFETPNINITSNNSFNPTTN